MWRSLFGAFSKIAAPATATTKTPDAVAINKSIIALRDAQTMLEKREVRLEKQIKTYAVSAKRKIGRRDRKGALYDLKRKKVMDKELSMIQNKKLTLERQIGALGTAAINFDVYDSIKEGVEAMRGENNADSIEVEDVQEVMEELGELRSQQDAIDEALGRSQTDDISDEELLKELEELNNEVEMEMENSPKALVYPDVPTKKLVSTVHPKSTTEAPAQSKSAVSSVATSIKPIKKDTALLDKPVYKRSKAKGNDIDIRPVSKKRRSKKRKLGDIDHQGYCRPQVSEQKLAPAAKKKRLGFSFSNGPHFRRVAPLEASSDPVNSGVVGGEQKVAASKPKKPLKEVSKSGVVIGPASDAVDKEEAENLALLDSLYD